MKKFIVCLLIVVFIGIGTPVLADDLTPQDLVRLQQIDPRYKYISDSNLDIFTFFDTKTIKLTYNKELNDQVIDVWIYEFYTTKGINDFIAKWSKIDSNKDYSKFDHSMFHWLFCKDKLYTLSTFYYSNDSVLDSTTFPDDTCYDIIPGTIGEIIANAIKDYMKPKPQVKPKSATKKKK